MRSGTTAAPAHALSPLHAGQSKPRTPGKKDRPHISAKRRSKHVQHSAYVKNQRRNVDDAVGAIIRTGIDSHGQNAAPAKQPQSEFLHAIFVVICSVFQHCRWLGIWLLTPFGTADWPRRPYMAQGSWTENGSIVPELQRKHANQDEAAQQELHGEVLSSIAFSPFIVSQSKSSEAGKTLSSSSPLAIGPVNFASRISLAELDLQAFQDLLSAGFDRRSVNSRALLRSPSERASVIRLNVGKKTNWLPDLDVYAIGLDEANVVNFVAKLDTGAYISVLAEKVAARFGIDQIDKSDRPDITVLAEEGVKPMGRIDIEFHQALNTQWYGESFYVIPDSVIQDRFDALLSREAIGQMNLLLLGPTLTGQGVPTESS